MKKETRLAGRNEIMEITVGISGASGVQYGIRLLEVLAEKGIKTHLILTDAANQIIENRN